MKKSAKWAAGLATLLMASGAAFAHGGRSTMPTRAAAGCPNGYRAYTGALGQGADGYQPKGTFYHAAAGVEAAILSGPYGTDFDLYLYKWNRYWGWQIVASSTGPTSAESIRFRGPSGYYLWDVNAYTGNGAYRLCVRQP